MSKLQLTIEMDSSHWLGNIYFKCSDLIFFFALSFGHAQILTPADRYGQYQMFPQKAPRVKHPQSGPVHTAD